MVGRDTDTPNEARGMLNIMDTVNRMLGRYTIDGYYVGKAKFEIILETAERLYGDTAHLSLIKIGKDAQKELGKAIDDSHIATMMKISGLDEHAKSFTDDYVARFIMVRCYEYVIVKRYEQEFGVKLGDK